MYDVIYIDPEGVETEIASALADRREASELACRVAAERGAGRLVLPGSVKLTHCVCVVPQEATTAAP
jgi:hypothetical protein